MLTYDLALNFIGQETELIIKWLRKECALRKLKFLWIGEPNAAEVLRKLESKKIRINYLVDNESNYYNPEDIFSRICYMVKDAGGAVIDDPDIARSCADKSVTHFDLIKAGLPVPYTVVVRNWQPDEFVLTRTQLKNLGRPFVIKPARGFGQKGVIKNATGDMQEIAEARDFNRGDNFLLQKKIIPIMLNSQVGWFRIYYLFGEIIPCFWHPETGHYKHVTLSEMINYRLFPMARIVSEIGQLVKMNFFSSEIAITGKGKERKFVIIDYVNDQCELCVRPTKISGPVPDVVRYIIETFVERAWMKKVGKEPLDSRSIWLAGAHDKFD